MSYPYQYGFYPDNEHTFEAGENAPEAVITWDSQIYDLVQNRVGDHMYRLRANYLSTRGAVKGSPYCDPGAVFVEHHTAHTLVEDGESYTKLHRVTLKGNPHMDQINHYIKTEFPGTYCQHDYDCCGNFYASPGRLDAMRYHATWDITILYIIEVWTMNI